MQESFHQSEVTPRAPIKSTEAPQPSANEVKPQVHETLKMYLEKQIVQPAMQSGGDGAPSKRLQKAWAIPLEAVFDRIVQIITDVDHVPLNMQYSVYADMRIFLSESVDAEEALLSTQFSLAWYDFHYHEAPSKMLQYLRTQGVVQNQLLKKDVSLILSLLHSGISLEVLETDEGMAVVQEILQRRKEFEKRKIVGEGVTLFSVEDDAHDTAPETFLESIKNTGTAITRINPETAGEDLRTMLAKSIAESDPAKPLTLVLTVHGMAQEGGYIDLPNHIHLSSKELADMFVKRGNMQNVTILTTQCLPRSTRAEDSFMDNFRERCLELGLSVPAIFMESAENQPAIMNPRPNIALKDFIKTPQIEERTLSNQFQSMDYLGKRLEKGGTELTGYDLLEAMEKVIGNQPVLILPPRAEGRALNFDLSLAEHEKSA